jgi:hypothetical protein
MEKPLRFINSTESFLPDDMLQIQLKEGSKELSKLTETTDDFPPEEESQIELEENSKEQSQLTETANKFLPEEEPQIELKEESKELSHLTETTNNFPPEEEPQNHLKEDSKELSKLSKTAETANNFPPEEEPQIELKEDSKELSALTETTKSFLPLATFNSGGLTPQGVNFTNFLQAAFLYVLRAATYSLYGLVIFWQKNISAKAACKLLLKLTQDGAWQPVVGASHKILVFSAYYDGRLDQMSSKEQLIMSGLGYNFTNS